ncbi:MAG: hypothetical protein ABII75_04905 [Candidatus Omnitrophota bacterium]
MRKILLYMLVGLLIEIPVAFAQDTEYNAALDSANSVHEALLERISVLKIFSYDKKTFMPIGKEQMHEALKVLPQERIDFFNPVVEGLSDATAYLFNKDDGALIIILVVMQFADDESANSFLTAEKEVMRAKDKVFEEYIKKIAYEDMAITKDEQAFISRKLVVKEAQNQLVTVIMSARKKYLIECNFLHGEYSNEELKNTILGLWKILSNN